MTNKLIIGGSTGDFYRIASARNTDEELSKYFTGKDIRALEIMFHGKEYLTCDISKDMIEKNFSHCSIHAPNNDYQNNQESHTILKYIENLCQTLPISNITIHPDCVVDWTFFDHYKHLPLSIENMDDRKDSFQGVNDIGRILSSNHYFHLTLDLQHCFVNDPSMQLSKDFHNAFGDKIVEYHLSGYHPEYLHYPLYQTKQNQILQALEKTNVPIIIESTFDEKDGLIKEIQYISNAKIF